MRLVVLVVVAVLCIAASARHVKHVSTKNLNQPRLYEKLLWQAQQLEEQPGGVVRCAAIAGTCRSSAEACDLVDYAIYDPTAVCPNNGFCCVPQCYIDYKGITSEIPTALVERDTPQRGPEYVQAEVCRTSEDRETGRSCTSTIALTVDAGCKEPMEKFSAKLLFESGTTMWENAFEQEFLQTFVKNFEGCWFGIQGYGTHGQRVFRYNIFNCFMRHSYHLKSLVPKEFYWAREMITQELRVYAEKKPALVYEDPVYRGAFCLPIAVNSKLMSMSFLSTSQIVLTQFAQGKCVYVFNLENDFGFKPVKPEGLNWSVAEKEILLPPGLCFNVERVKENRLDFVEAAQPEELNVQKQFEIQLVACTEDIKQTALLI
eukprot:c2564_g1_i1.p1 GENE.c2564_g1_i1~~c2564_g1_i1.p1  ORF type:complete len:374 (+),score=94.10 c2564_g1_i1:79-1200(+)